MMRRLISTLSVATLLALTVVPGTAPGLQKARNPIIYADVPDMAMIRVGSTYYMSSTTMHMSPGLPIMASNDLINWRLVRYAYDELDTDDALMLRNGQQAYGRGSWASSLRYHDGVYYATTFSNTTAKTYVYTTHDIEHGPWNKVSFPNRFHDHSLFFDDDGRRYMVHGSGALRLTEMKKDVSGVKPGGVDQVIIADAGAPSGRPGGLSAEGSQLFKIRGRYYLINIAWPQGDMRTVIVHRADKITGPYLGRVALHDRGIAQGGLIDTPDGRWFAYLFRDAGAVGRIPYLAPVRWIDGWPVIGDDRGRVPDELDLPSQNGVMPSIVTSDEFGPRLSGQRPLPLEWQWNHQPDTSLWSLTERVGYLRLKTGRPVGGLLQARNTLTQRSFGPRSSAIIAIDTSKMKSGDFAGLSLFQQQFGLIGVRASDTGRNIVVSQSGADGTHDVDSLCLEQVVVHLRADADFGDGTDIARFYFSLDGHHWTSLGTPLKMRYTIPHFMGYRFGVFNTASIISGGWIDIDYFRISDRPPPSN